MASILQLAGMLPRDPQFREFVGQYTVPPSDVTVDEAAAFIREVCRIESRRELLDDRERAERFHSFIRRPFLAWKAGLLLLGACSLPKTHIRALERNQPLRRAA